MDLAGIDDVPERTTMAAMRLVTLYTDGGARGNPGPAAIGVAVCGEANDELEEHQQHIGHATNNEAEYRALIKGLDLAAAHTRKEVRCVMDSELVVRHLMGEYRSVALTARQRSAR